METATSHAALAEVVPERTRKHFIEVGKNSVGQGTIFSSF